MEASATGLEACFELCVLRAARRLLCEASELHGALLADAPAQRYAALGFQGQRSAPLSASRPHAWPPSFLLSFLSNACLTRSQESLCFQSAKHSQNSMFPICEAQPKHEAASSTLKSPSTQHCQGAEEVEQLVTACECLYLKAEQAVAAAR